MLGETNDIFKENWSKKVDEKSIFAEKSDSVAQGVGNVGAFCRNVKYCASTWWK
ncbi:MAG: hypothetical protein L6V81_11250 [Clostridium sp.]|nr:MAG: hypothetical protein L6V81_11250 [Clostridium sp.]